MKTTLDALLPFLPLLLAILGLVFLVSAAFVFAPIVGLCATGVALLLVGYGIEVNQR